MIRQVLLICFATLFLTTSALAGASHVSGPWVIETDANPATCEASSSASDLCASDDIRCDNDLYVGDDASIAGDLAVTGSATIATVATQLEAIRFCGNGSATGIADYMGPVVRHAADDMTIYAFGGTGCDALNNATVGTADAPWHTSFSYTPVAMVCVGRCTGATAASDAITYTFVNATAEDAVLTCTAPAWTGDDDIQQCAVEGAGTTVAANAAVAIKTIASGSDACEGTGDDFECLVYVTF